jgi:hypothetical protein
MPVERKMLEQEKRNVFEKIDLDKTNKISLERNKNFFIASKN